MINQTRQQTKYFLGLAAKRGNGFSYMNNSLEDEETIEKMRTDIDASQENALSLCTEKVLLARQAYDLVSFVHLFAIVFVIEHVLFCCY